MIRRPGSRFDRGRIAAGGAAAAAFDPATLALSGWWQGDDYAVGAWTGKASAGASGGRNLTEATNPPAVGASWNGHPTVDFDGTNDELRNALAISNFIAAGAFTAWVVFEADAFDTLGLPSSTGCFLTDGAASNYWAVAASGVSGVTAVGRNYEFDGGDKIVDTTTVLSTGVRYLLEVRHEAGNIYARINNGSESAPVAAGDVGSLAGALFCGRSYNGVFFFNGRLGEIAIATGAVAAGDRQSYRDYLIARYTIP